MVRERDTVVLTRDVPEHRLAEGNLGTVVFRETPSTPSAHVSRIEFG